MTVYATVIPSGKVGMGPEEFFSSSSETSDTSSIPGGLNVTCAYSQETLRITYISVHSYDPPRPCRKQSKNYLKFSVVLYSLPAKSVLLK